jgi:phage-related protein
VSNVVGNAAIQIDPTGQDEFGEKILASVSPLLSQIEDQFGSLFDVIENGTTEAGDQFETMFEGVIAGATLVGQELEDTIGGSLVAIEEQAQQAGLDTGTIFGESIVETFGESLGGIGSVADVAFEDVQNKGSAAAEATKEDVGGKFGQLGEIITGVALGNILYDSLRGGVTAALGAIGELGSGIVQLGTTFHSAFSTIRIDTGETGANLSGLEQSFQNLAEKSPAGLGDVSTAIAIVNQRLGDTGQPLEDVAQGILRLSLLTGTDLNTNLQAITGAFNLFGVSADQQAGKLDYLFRVFQQTGAPVATLTSGLSTLGPLATVTGLSFDQTATIIGKLNNAGLDAGSAMMAFNKILNEAKTEHVDASVVFNRLFEGIHNGTIAFDSDQNIFTGRASRMFELIRSGKLDYQAFTASLEGGGDSLAQAATDTMSWQAQLAILGNQLSLVIQPIVTFVFNTITSAVSAVRPVIVALASEVSNFLAPAWQGLVLALQPAWDWLDKVRVAFGEALDTLGEGGDIFDAVRTFFTDLTGSADTANTVAEVFGTITDNVVGLWDALQPVRDAFASVLGVVRELIDAHPEAFFAVLAALVGGGFVGLLVGIAVALSGIAAAAAAIAGPVLATVAIFAAAAAGITEVVVAALELYNNFQTVRDIVGSVGSAISTGFTAALQFLSDLWAQVQPALVSGAQAIADVWTNQIGPSLSGVLEALQPAIQWVQDHWDLLRIILLALVSPAADVAAGLGFLYEHFEAVRETVGAVIGVVGEFASDLIAFAGGAISNVIDEVRALVDILTGLFSLDWSKVGQGFAELGGVVGRALQLIGQLVVNLAQDWFNGWRAALTNLATNVPQWLGNIGAILVDVFEDAMSALGADVFSNVPGWVGQFLANLPQWLGDVGAILVDIFEDAMSALGADVFSNVPGWVGTFLSNLPQWLGDLGAILVDIFEDAFSGIGSGLAGVPGWVGTFLSNLPQWFGNVGAILVDIFENALAGLGTLLSNVPQWLGDLGAILTDWAENGLAGLGTLLSNIPQWLGDLGAILVGWAQAGWNFISDHWTDILGAFVKGLATVPGLILAGLGKVGETLLGWLKSGWDFVASNWQAILYNVIRGALTVPGLIVQGIGRLGDALLGSFQQAWDWVANNWQTVLGNFLAGLQALPGLIIGGLASLGGLLVGWLTDAWNWLTSNGPGILAGVLGFIASIPGRFIDGLQVMGATLVTWLTGAWQWLVDNGGPVLLNVLAWVASLPGKFVDAMFDIGSRFVSMITGAWQWVVDNGGDILRSVLDWFTSLPQKFVDAIGDVAGKLKDVGGSLISGLWEGVKSTLGSILNSIGALGGPFVQAFKDAFGIKSPSALMMPIGEQIAAGVGAGILNSWSTHVTDQLANLANSAGGVALSSYHPDTTQGLDDKLTGLYQNNSTVAGYRFAGDAGVIGPNGENIGSSVADFPQQLKDALGIVTTGLKDSYGDAISGFMDEFNAKLTTVTSQAQADAFDRFLGERQGITQVGTQVQAEAMQEALGKLVVGNVGAGLGPGLYAGRSPAGAPSPAPAGLAAANAGNSVHVDKIEIHPPESAKDPVDYGKKASSTIISEIARNA